MITISSSTALKCLLLLREAVEVWQKGSAIVISDVCGNKAGIYLRRSTRRDIGGILTIHYYSTGFK